MSVPPIVPSQNPFSKWSPQPFFLDWLKKKLIDILKKIIKLKSSKTNKNILSYLSYKQQNKRTMFIMNYIDIIEEPLSYKQQNKKIMFITNYIDIIEEPEATTAV